MRNADATGGPRPGRALIATVVNRAVQAVPDLPLSAGARRAIWHGLDRTDPAGVEASELLLATDPDGQLLTLALEQDLPREVTLAAASSRWLTGARLARLTPPDDPDPAVLRRVLSYGEPDTVAVAYTWLTDRGLPLPRPGALASAAATCPSLLGRLLADLPAEAAAALACRVATLPARRTRPGPTGDDALPGLPGTLARHEVAAVALADRPESVDAGTVEHLLHQTGWALTLRPELATTALLDALWTLGRHQPDLAAKQLPRPGHHLPEPSRTRPLSDPATLCALVERRTVQTLVEIDTQLDADERAWTTLLALAAGWSGSVGELVDAARTLR